MKTLAEKRNAAAPAEPSPSMAPEPVGQPYGAQTTAVAALVETLAALGVEQAFGVSGGAIALLFDALEESPIRLHHFRHESGAAFAATEAWFAGHKPVVVFTTTGPGILNALTGLTAARWDGAKVILVSGATGAGQRGRWATQETSPYTMPQDVLYTRGPIFDFAVRMEHPAELPNIVRRLGLGLSRPGGFVAHVSMPMPIQSKRIDRLSLTTPVQTVAAGVDAGEVERVAALLRQGSFAIWLGFGATRSAAVVRELVERSGVAVFCSPRAKGVVPESHPQLVGVTGLGGHQAVTDYMVQQRPERVLVLGTRLGEATSFWDRDLQPCEGFIHVDLDPDVPGTAYPDCQTIGVQAEIGSFVKALLPHLPVRAEAARTWRPPQPDRTEQLPMGLVGRSPVRPQVLMAAIQHHVIDAHGALVMSESGNAFAWCNHYLKFEEAGSYRVSTLFGSMGHMASGVVGAALARCGKAVAVVGDGSMLMNCELSTAAQYRVPAVWVVLNDAGYGMCRDGHKALGLTSKGVDFPRADFVRLARSMGADGVKVESEDLLELAFEKAMRAEGPFVLDVRIDPGETSPLLSRFESLIQQGSSKNVAGWDV